MSLVTYSKSNFTLSTAEIPYSYTIGDHTGKIEPVIVKSFSITPAMDVAISLTMEDSDTLELSLQPNDTGSPSIVVVNLNGWVQDQTDPDIFSYADNANYCLSISLGINTKNNQEEIGIIIVGTTDIP